jgi:hypothetical protein
LTGTKRDGLALGRKLSFIRDDTPGEEDFVIGWIKTPITFLISTITYENAWLTSKRQLVIGIGSKKWITQASKSP